MSDARETAEAIVFALKKRQNFPDFGRLTSAIERAIASRDAVIAEREAQLAETREKLTMHLAHVGAWLSEIVGFTGVADVKTVAEATAQVSTKFAALRSRAEATEFRIADLEAKLAEAVTAITEILAEHARQPFSYPTMACLVAARQFISRQQEAAIERHRNKDAGGEHK